MFKHWETFHGDFYKLKTTTDRYSDRTAAGFLKQMIRAKAACDKRKAELSIGVDAARNAGAVGKTLADFQKHKPFADAKKNLDGAATELQDISKA